MTRELALTPSTAPLQPSERLEIFATRLREVDSFPYEFPGDRFIKAGLGELTLDPTSRAPLIRLHGGEGEQDLFISYDDQGNFVPQLGSTSTSTDKFIERVGDLILRKCDPRST